MLWCVVCYGNIFTGKFCFTNPTYQLYPKRGVSMPTRPEDILTSSAMITTGCGLRACHRTSADPDRRLTVRLNTHCAHNFIYQAQLPIAGLAMQLEVDGNILLFQDPLCAPLMAECNRSRLKLRLKDFPWHRHHHG